MRPIVVDALLHDLYYHGSCNYMITDTEDEFNIARLPHDWEVYRLEVR